VLRWERKLSGRYEDAVNFKSHSSFAQQGHHIKTASRPNTAPMQPFRNTAITGLLL
jgi:hypothetical protein